MSPDSRKKTIATLASCALAVSLAATPVVANAEPDPAQGPKNIIVMIADGAGFNHYDIANLYETGVGNHQINVDAATGAVERIPGSSQQGYQSWPVQVASSTFSASGSGYVTEEAWGDFEWVVTGFTDSAAAGTALGTGVKTLNGTLGFDAEGGRLLTLGEQAKAVGKKVGLVTSVPFNHATPAGFIAHSQSRNDYQSIATEMIDSGVDVLMGGGHPNFDDNGKSRVPDYTWISADDFARLTSGATDFSYLESKADFEALASGDAPDKAFGLAQVSQTLQYRRAGIDNKSVKPYTDPLVSNVPSLETMSKGALNVLDSGEQGFFLMIEGGAVDWASHANQTTRVIEEQQDFNRSVAAVEAWVAEHSSWDETLVIVTADHETGHLNGPGSKPNWTAMTGTAGELPNVSWHSDNHTNALVPVYAKGAGAQRLAALADGWDLVRGAYLDNTEIGQTVFDFLGHASSGKPDSVAVQAEVPIGAPGGSLSLTVAPSDPIMLSPGTAGQLPSVTVSDTRSEVQSLGKGWVVVGAAEDFKAGNRVLPAKSMSWTPAIVSTEGGAEPGATAAFDGPVTLAKATRITRMGKTEANAQLTLEVPGDAPVGRYGTEITLSLFAQD